MAYPPAIQRIFDSASDPDEIEAMHKYLEESKPVHKTIIGYRCRHCGKEFLNSDLRKIGDIQDILSIHQRSYHFEIAIGCGDNYEKMEV